MREEVGFDTVPGYCYCALFSPLLPSKTFLPESLVARILYEPRVVTTLKYLKSRPEVFGTLKYVLRIVDIDSKNFLGGVILTLNFGTSALVSTTKY